MSPFELSDFLSLLDKEDGVWVIVLLLFVQVVRHMRSDSAGPKWTRNGTMNSILDAFTLRFQEVLEKGQAGFARFPSENHTKLDQVAEVLESHSEALKQLIERQNEQEDSWPDMLRQTEREISTGMQEMTKTLQAISNELINVRICPHDLTATNQIIKELEERRDKAEKDRKKKLGVKA